MSTPTTVADLAARELAGTFAGQLIGPADPEYDDARGVHNAMIDRRPALVARCTGPDDVASAIAVARAHDLPIAVRGGGHNGAGLGVVDAGIVVDLSQLREVDVDPVQRVARVGGGATWGEVDRATHEHGLATPSGIISTTGVGGLTLGGGHGYLSRKLGLTIDNLVAAEVVLADGRQVRASAEEEPQLFWALRGGGGNFGVVTSFELALHPLSTVLAGPTFWPVEETPRVLRRYGELLDGWPRELYGFFLIGHVPPAPPFPEELHGRKVCGVVWCHTGSQEVFDRETAPLLDVATPLLHAPHEMPYPDLQSTFDGLYPPGQQWYWRGDFVRDLPDDAIDAHARFAAAVPTPQSTMHLYPIDGAVHDVGASDTAFRYRDVRFSQVIAGVDPDPANAAALREWTVGYWEATHPYSAGGAYVNFMMDEGRDRVKATYGDNYGRLARVKAIYDRENILRVNQNIQPAGG
jgi:hypothetical protein